MTATSQRRTYDGLPLFSYGFRPFFLLGSIYAGLAILVWLPVFHGEITLTSAFAPRDWHVHEMLFGYLPAVITGFLFTAIPNWTGRLPIQGTPLMVLVAVWLAGRVWRDVLGATPAGWLAMLVDTGFLLLVAAGGCPRNPRRPQLAKSQCGDGAAAAAREQYRLPPRGAFSRRGRHRHPLRHRGGGIADRADRRADRSELHPQLAGARKSRPPAGAVRPLRHHRRCRRRAGVSVLGRQPDRRSHRRRTRIGRIAASGAARTLGRRPHRCASACC